MRKNSKNIDIDFGKVIETFNINGKTAAQEYVRNTYGIDYNVVYRRIHKETGYFFNKSNRKYELKPSCDGQFMSLDELCRDKPQVSVRSSPDIVSPIMDIENVLIDLMKDRMLELSKYIYINQSSKKILIKLQNLKDAGYDVSIT